MSATTTRRPNTVDVDALAQETQTRLEQLREERQRLSLDVLLNPKARRRLVRVEQELGDAEHELQRLDLAKAEREQRDAQARSAERDERQRAAYSDAQRLQADRQRSAKAIDRAATKLVDAIAGYVETCQQQQTKLREAGQPDTAHIARPGGYQVEAALAHALREAVWENRIRLADGFGRLQQLALITVAHQKPLADGDARPVEPAAAK